MHHPRFLHLFAAATSLLANTRNGHCFVSPHLRTSAKNLRTVFFRTSPLHDYQHPKAVVSTIPYSTRRLSSILRINSSRHMTTATRSHNENMSPTISISDSFDGGNGKWARTEVDPLTKEVTVFVEIRKDPYTLYEDKQHSQYFSFRSSVQSIHQPTKIRYILSNAGQVSFPTAWPGSSTFFSTTPFDPHSWTRKLDTAYDPQSGFLSWMHEHVPHPGNTGGTSSVYFAYFPPYSYERHLNFIAQCSTFASTSSQRNFPSKVSVYSLGQTLDGREMDCIQIGHGERIGWLIHRQHPGETMAEFFAEGFVHRLLGLNTGGCIDGMTRQALDMYTFYIIPNMCPDGSVRGYLRTNAGGQNLNREWANGTMKQKNVHSTDSEVNNALDEIIYHAPTLERSPEVFHVLKKMDETGVDAFLDVHGDEELPFNFVAGAEGCANWSPRMEALQGSFLAAYCRANSDMQKEVSYDPEPPGQARTNVCSNQIAIRYDCLAFTLEMPFKDCRSNPDPIRGWSPGRAMMLGTSAIDAFVHVHPLLRENQTEFWKDLSLEDKYVRPSCKY